MAMELEGRIARKMNVQTGTSARGAWAKQEFIFEYQEGNFPSQVCMNVWGEDKVKELERHQVGDRVKVAFNLSSREYNGRWYTDVRAWRIESVGSAPADYAAGAVAGDPGKILEGISSVTQEQASAGGYDYAGSAGSYAAPTGAPMPSADDMSAPLADDDLPF